MKRLIVLVLAAAMARAQAAPEPVPVVATFSILADWASEVGGERVTVTSLVGREGDGHVYEPSPLAGRALAAARLVLVNGLGYEGWLRRLIAASGTRATVVVASEGVQPITREAGEEEAHRDGGHRHGETDKVDPHAWQDAANAKIYVANIVSALCEADPPGCSDFRARGRRYTDRLDRLDAEIRAALAGVAAQRRVVIVPHDAFAYYRQAYGVTFLAPQGISTEARPSARDVARLIDRIRTSGARGLFLENVSDPRLIRQIARETGLEPGGALYSDALSPPGGPADTYIDMMRHNTRTLVEGIR